MLTAIHSYQGKIITIAKNTTIPMFYTAYGGALRPGRRTCSRPCRQAPFLLVVSQSSYTRTRSAPQSLTPAVGKLGNEQPWSSLARPTPAWVRSRSAVAAMAVTFHALRLRHRENRHHRRESRRLPLRNRRHGKNPQTRHSNPRTVMDFHCCCEQH